MNLFSQHIKAKKSEKLKKKFFYLLDNLFSKQKDFSDIDAKINGKKIGLIESTSLQYAKEWRRQHPETMAINILQRVHLSEQSYIQYKYTKGRTKVYATHHSITIPIDVLPVLKKFASFRYDKNGEAYLWIDERNYFAKDALQNAKNFLKVLRKWIKKQHDIDNQEIHTFVNKMNKVLKKGIKPKKTGALIDIAKKTWAEVDRVIKDAELGIHPDFEQVNTNCTPYIYKQYTFTSTYYNKNILSSNKTQKITRNLNKKERKSRYWEKYNKKMHHIRMLENFRTLHDACRYNCGIWDFTKSKLHREISQGRSNFYKKENEALFVNMYLKFRYNTYGIDKKKPINLKEELHIINYWTKEWSNSGK